MIRVTRLNGEELVVNADLIETVEATPDTVLTMTTGRKLVVRESVAEVVARTLAYRRAAWLSLPTAAETAGEPGGRGAAGNVRGEGSEGAEGGQAGAAPGAGEEEG